MNTKKMMLITDLNKKLRKFLTGDLDLKNNAFFKRQ